MTCKKTHQEGKGSDRGRGSHFISLVSAGYSGGAAGRARRARGRAVCGAAHLTLLLPLPAHPAAACLNKESCTTKAPPPRPR